MALVAGLGLLLVADSATADPYQPEQQRGLASWYGPRHHGRRTASGARST
jgi:rare lipoprotein A (peptidoglycan hydrolase)